MSTLFLVPARGGSKGFPGKNLALCGGIPLVARAVRTARRAAARLPHACATVCTTDDPGIADVAREWGADVPFMRPVELASDDVRSIDVVRHALATLASPFDAVVLLQPTSPLTDETDVLGALELFWRTGDPVVAVCRAEHPLEWHFRCGEDGRLDPTAGGGAAHQRQQGTPAYRPNGAVYVASPDQIAHEGFFTAGTRGHVMPADRSVDVDVESDLAVAETLLRRRPVPRLHIAGREIGGGAPCFVIAEAGVNHNGRLDTALRLVDAAADAGADAVKFQTFRAERLATTAAPKAAYQITATGDAESQLDMLRRLELSDDDHRAIVRRCEARGLTFLSTPFDEESAGLLDRLGVPAFKISSGDLTHSGLLAFVAAFGKPMILSTGMASMADIDAAVDAIGRAGGAHPALLQCVSEYPADPGDANLLAMDTLTAAFGCAAGYSDHTPGIETAIAAAALGASIVEKHFTLDRTMGGPDHKASIEPGNLAKMMKGIRIAEKARGDGNKRPVAGERETAAVARKSLVAARDIPAGAVLGADDIAVRRPGTGLSPALRPQVIGRKARVAIRCGDLLTQDMLS